MSGRAHGGLWDRGRGRFVSQNRALGGDHRDPGGDGGAWGAWRREFVSHFRVFGGWKGGGVEGWRDGGIGPGSRLPFFPAQRAPAILPRSGRPGAAEGLEFVERSEEHKSELQAP